MLEPALAEVAVGSRREARIARAIESRRCGKLADIITHHDTALRAYVHRRLRNADEVADVVQDVYLRVLQNLNAPTLLAYPRFYLYKTARNLLMDRKRREDVRRPHVMQSTDEMEDVAGHAESPEHFLRTAEGLDALEAVLMALSPIRRQVFLLSRMDGLGYREIAERTGLSLRTVERYMSDTLVILQEQIEQCV